MHAFDNDWYYDWYCMGKQDCHHKQQMKTITSYNRWKKTTPNVMIIPKCHDHSQMSLSIPNVMIIYNQWKSITTKTFIYDKMKKWPSKQQSLKKWPWKMTTETTTINNRCQSTMKKNDQAENHRNEQQDGKHG